jgi:thiamine biosynthesis protein ThiS
MKIILNNRETDIDGKSNITITELFEIQKFTFPHIIVKVNGKLIKREFYNETVLKENDKVDAIHLIGGG